MNVKWKSKFTYILNPEYWKELEDIYWNDVILKKEIEAPLKIKTNNNNFIMLKQMQVIHRKNLLDKLSVAYFWYLMILLDTLDYDNKVDFNIYNNYDISIPMIKVIRKKYKDLWFIKKFWNDFYMNPEIARKWQHIPLYIINLFK